MPLRSGSDAAGSQVIARLIERDCGFNDRLPGSGQATAAVMALIEEGLSSDTGGENPMATFDSGSRFCDAVPTTRSITSLLGIHLTGLDDLSPRAVRRRSLQAWRMPALSRRLGRNSLWAPAHNKVLVTNRSVRDSKLQDPVGQRPSAT